MILEVVFQQLVWAFRIWLDFIMIYFFESLSCLFVFIVKFDFGCYQLDLFNYLFNFIRQQKSVLYIVELHTPKNLLS